MTHLTVNVNTKKRVGIIGSGNWGSAIAKIVGRNCQASEDFEQRVTMYVYEEMIGDRKLTEIINTEHENVKYLPGHKLPENIVAVPDVVDCCKDADILIFVVPHQFVRRICSQLKGKLKPDSIAVSLIKGLDITDSGIQLISAVIESILDVHCAVLMGANLAGEVAAENFCETTIGCADKARGALLKKLFQAPSFRVSVVPDEHIVEICGALKNVVAVGAGFVDGLGHGDNTKAAIIRIGLMEMIKFGEMFYNGGALSTYFESCGVADLITTCYGGRNRRIAEAHVKTGKSFDQLEDELLNGQKLQGPHTAMEINLMLKKKNMESKFPLFTAIHRVCADGHPPQSMIDCLKTHPDPDGYLPDVPATPH